MVKLVRSVASHYPQINVDLLSTGAFLHDVGKVFELSSDITIDYSSDGRLLGHIVLGTMLVEKKMEAIEGFPPELRKQLLHLILAHQGDGTMGSPVKPLTLEALMLHYCDEMDSRVNAFMQIKANTPEGQDFSDYVRLMDRFFYFKPVEEMGNPDKTNER
jgi:3'-5' exoribonuclease